jgi:mannose-6-phosphate isomerase-like protein (cupin superfamily)
MTAGFTCRDLPEVSALLSGRGPIDPGVGVVTERVQIYWRRDDDRIDARAHAHTACDEFFLVLQGSLVFEVEGEERVVGPRQWCHFATGTFHRISRVVPPIEAIVLRAPSVADKVER